MLNFDKIGRPVCIIKGGSMDGKMIHLNADPDNTLNVKYIDEFRLPDGDTGKLETAVDTTSERNIVYITGPSGSGKTYFSAQYIKKYQKKFPSRLIILFSAIEHDESLDQLGVKRIKLNKSLVEDPIKPKDLQDTLCIFDDVDSIQNKPIRSAVMSLLNSVLQEGRHFQTSALLTYHAPTDRMNTRLMLCESHIVVSFLNSGSAHSLKYLFNTYLGIDDVMLKKLKKEKTRACVVFKNYPACVMTDKMIRLLNKDDE